MTLSVTEIERRLSRLIKDECCTEDVLSCLWDEAHFTLHENSMWDFKVLINLDSQDSHSDPDYQARCCETVKDIAAFYNTSGGYIVLGVEDATRLISANPVKALDVDAVEKRILSDTGVVIPFTYRRVTFQNSQLGLVYIPKRTANIPLAFQKNAKQHSSGKTAYKKDNILIRDGARSIVAESVNQLSFAFGPRYSSFELPSASAQKSSIDSNLRSRDPSLIEFVGRSEDLSALWQWLVDRFNPVKLVTGVGGVGKTTIVRMFVEQLLDRAPFGFERVIWLTAKGKHWRSHSGKVEVARLEEQPHFNSETTLWMSLLLELGYLENEVAEAMESDSLKQHVLNALNITPSFIVIDDLDSLSDDEQNNVFQAINSIVLRTVTSSVTSRVIITARLKLGAASSQLLKVHGFNKEEFRRFISVISEKFQVQLQLNGKPKTFEKFYKLSAGSPMYATEIVRLVARGQDSLDQCLERFKNSDGEEVRKFSFERELGSLSDSQLRTIYALCIFEKASFLEIKQATESPVKLLTDDLQRLRDFHLVSTHEQPSEAGQTFEADLSIILLRGLVAKRIEGGAKRVESRCKQLRDATARGASDVGLTISKIVALWDEGRADEALSLAKRAVSERSNKNADLLCALGRAYLKVEPPQADLADAVLRDAYQSGCNRHDIFDLWIEAKKVREDWSGLVDTAERAAKQTSRPKYFLEIARAHISLANMAKQSQQFEEAIRQFRACGTVINASLKNLSDGGLFEDANSLRRAAYLEAIAIAKVEYRNPNSALETWMICVEAFNAFVRVRSVLVDGVENLGVWVEHVVKFRNSLDENTKAKISSALIELKKIEYELHSKSWSDAFALQRVRDGIVRISRVTNAVRPDDN